MEDKRDKKIIYLGIVCGLILLVNSILLLGNEYKVYALITIALFAIDCLLLLFYLNNTKSIHDKYQSDIKYILKTFDSVLAKIDGELKLDDLEIIKLESFDDIVNAQEEIKKPILYTLDNTTAVFLIIDRNVLYYTTVKEDEKLKNPLEIELLIKNKNKKNKASDCDALLEGIDHTTIVQTKSNKKYKISPVKQGNEVSNTQALAYVKNNFFPKVKDGNENVSDKQALSFLKNKYEEEKK